MGMFAARCRISLTVLALEAPSDPLSVAPKNLPLASMILQWQNEDASPDPQGHSPSHSFEVSKPKANPRNLIR
jgi:hypothetical protein